MINTERTWDLALALVASGRAKNIEDALRDALAQLDGLHEVRLQVGRRRADPMPAPGVPPLEGRVVEVTELVWRPDTREVARITRTES